MRLQGLEQPPLETARANASRCARTVRLVDITDSGGIFACEAPAMMSELGPDIHPAPSSFSRS